MESKRWCDECKQFKYTSECTHARAVVSVPDDRRRVKINSLGLLTFGEHGETLIGGQSTCVLEARPQAYFQPLRLVVPPSLAPWFKLIDLRIGVITLMMNAGGGIRTDAFPPQPADGLLVNNLQGAPVMPPGVSMFLTVTNLDQYAHTFEALVYGDEMHTDRHTDALLDLRRQADMADVLAQIAAKA